MCCVKENRLSIPETVDGVLQPHDLLLVADPWAAGAS
jgi:hypothetical protein